MTTYRSTGSAVRVDFENTYEYQGHEFDDMESVIGLLNFNLHTAQDINMYSKDIESTLKYAVELAKEIVDSTHPVNPYTRHKKTNSLRDSIKYDTSTLGGGSGGRLYADAKDSRGHKYAGHIEYGFTDRAGAPHGPWPFLRPAMRMALSATRYDFAKTMENLIGGNFNSGYMSIGSKNARANVHSLFGSNRGAIDAMKRDFQSFEERYHGAGEGRWSSAENGIGFKSGVEWGFTADPESWSSGWL